MMVVMRMGIVMIVCIALGGVAHAQSYPQQQYPQQPYPQQQPAPYYGPQPYGYQQPPLNARLTVDAQWLLERGFISDGEHLGGGLAALFVGFGVGQAVQGRSGRKGWIFTVGGLGANAV